MKKVRSRKGAAQKKGTKKRRTKKELELRHISRVDQERKRQHGWLVRLMRNGEKFQKFFFDSVAGSRSASLHEAKEHRDALLLLYPKPEHGNMFNRTNARNTSGHPGVSRTRSLRRGRSYDVWQAGWILPNGKGVNHKFHFSPDGRSEREAKRLAIAARREGVAEIERLMREKKAKRIRRKAATKKRRR